jgi:hypothetical protein
MTVDRNKINSFALMYGDKITPDQANEALSNISIFFIEANLNWIPENVHEAIDTLRGFIKQSVSKSNVKVVYEYKLKRADGKYLNKSSWDQKGKTYKNKAALMTALGTYISEAINNDNSRPKYDYPNIPKLGDTEAYEKYRTASAAWRDYHEDRNIRAQYIPEDWIVVAIAVNTAKEPIETSARVWYASKTKENV